MSKFENAEKYYGVLKRTRRSALEVEVDYRSQRVQLYTGDLVAIAAATVFFALATKLFVWYPFLWIMPAALAGLCVMKLGEHTRGLRAAKARMGVR